MADQRSSAPIKRAEQLKRWEESDTNRQPNTPRSSTKIKFSSGCVFLAACTAGDKEEVIRLLNQGADINTANVDGLTALHQACIDDNLDMVEFLVSHGADINRGDNEGWTPLHATASCGFISIARYLIENGADVAAVNYDGELPVDIAESDKMEDLLQSIIRERGIDTASARAAECRRLLADAERWAEKGYCDYRDTGASGTPLHVAAAKGYMEAARILLERCGVDVDVRDSDGWTPLHAAALWGQKDAAELLLRHGADIDAKNYAGQTCIDLVESSMASWLEERRAALKLRKMSDNSVQNNKKKKALLIEDSSPIEKKELPPPLPPKPKEEPSLPPVLSVNVEIPAKDALILSPVPETAPSTPTAPEWRENNWVGSPQPGNKSSPSCVPEQNGIAPETPTKLGNIFKNFFKTRVLPVRDEESETQRKAHAKRVRGSRRSTQGVNLDEVKSAEQIARGTNGSLTTSAIVSPALTASAPVAPVAAATVTTNTANALASTVAATITPALGEPKPTWRLQVQEDRNPPNGAGGPKSPTSLSHPSTPPTSSPDTSFEKSATEASTAALNVIQRRRRPKRRSTGVAHLNAESGGDSCEAGEDEDDQRDYRALWEEACVEIERLKSVLSTTERQLREARALANQNSISEIEKREKRAMERKLSEMEEELKQLQKLKMENEKLRAENRALTRVVSKLTNSHGK